MVQLLRSACRVHSDDELRSEDGMLKLAEGSDDAVGSGGMATTQGMRVFLLSLVRHVLGTRHLFVVFASCDPDFYQPPFLSNYVPTSSFAKCSCTRCDMRRL